MADEMYEEVKYEDLDSIKQDLIDAAQKAMLNAYNPYSKFYVGAALLADVKSGLGIITGSNVENASYGGTNCAERSAVFRANAEGYRVFESIAIIARGERSDCEEPTAPCGICRQVLYEFSQIGEQDLEVIMSNTKKTKIWRTSISKLLPLAFGPTDLGIEVARYQ